MDTDEEIDTLAMQVELSTESAEFALQRLESCIIALWEERSNVEHQAQIAKTLDTWLFSILIFIGFSICLFCAWKLGKACALRERSPERPELQYVPAHPYESI